MKVLQITLLCLCMFLISAVSGLPPNPCKPNPCKFGKCYPLGHGKYKCQVGCYCNGVVYKPGAKFRIDCNLCYCQADGYVSCTKKDCGYCTHKGKSYKPGSVIEIGCVVCLCFNGNWVCNLIEDCKEEAENPKLSKVEED